MVTIVLLPILYEWTSSTTMHLWSFSSQEQWSCKPKIQILLSSLIIAKFIIHFLVHIIMLHALLSLTFLNQWWIIFPEKPTQQVGCGHISQNVCSDCVPLNHRAPINEAHLQWARCCCVCMPKIVRNTYMLVTVGSWCYIVSGYCIETQLLCQQTPSTLCALYSALKIQSFAPMWVQGCGIQDRGRWVLCRFLAL